jgi:hypothetical protein
VRAEPLRPPPAHFDERETPTVSIEQDYIDAINRGDDQAAARYGQQLDALDQADRDRLEAPGALAAAALWYAAQGITVFPCQPRGKQPATRNGFKDATTNTTLIAAWWADQPACNIGLPTGHQFDVVDVDGHDGINSIYFGDDPLYESLNILGKAFTTRDGGVHLYVPPTGLGNKAALYPGVDYRGQGGYVIAPPSVGENGRRYRWAQPLRLPVDVA